MPSVDFPNALRYNTLQFSANVLLHLRSREDAEMGTIGEQLQPLLAQFRSVLPQYIDEYYELVTGICTHLLKYSSLAESCSKSGAYHGKRLQSLANIKAMIQSIESQPDVLKMMRNMHRQTPAA
jgi:hypothetical protein